MHCHEALKSGSG